MAIMDAKLLLSDDQAITTDAASENTLDLGAQVDYYGSSVTPDPGHGTPLYLHIVVTTTFDTAEEDGTLTVSLRHDTASNFGSEVTLYQTPAIAEATLVAGYRVLCMALPSSINRYVRVYYDVGAHAFTAGKISAWISPVPEQLL